MIVYPLSEDGKTLVPYTLLDITVRMSFNMTEADMIAMTSSYTVADGQTLESISNDLYGTPYYFWTIMYVNNTFDYLTDWYMTEEQLMQYCIDKYGESHVYDYVSYVDDYGNAIESADARLNDFKNNTSVYTNTKYTGTVSLTTNFDYESAENEKRRQIRVIKPVYINQFIETFKTMIKAAY